MHNVRCPVTRSLLVPITARGRLDMWTTCICVFTILPLLIKSESNLLYDLTNGWTPVSSETVYDQFKREGIQAPQYIASHHIQVLNTDINQIISQHDALKLPDNVKHKERDSNYIQLQLSDVNQIISQHETLKIPENEKLKNSQDLEDKCRDDNSHCDQTKNEANEEPKSEYSLNNSHNTNQNGTEGYKPIRRSKKIAKFDQINDRQNILLIKNVTPKSNERTYEVTENVMEQEKSVFNEGYIYESPKKNRSLGLFEILAKYNINKDDELSNYALSRKPKSESYFNQNLPQNHQNLVFFKNNNQNHLPVDPVIAVFLSNYGYYLQGMYGKNNMYNNLYGYLASNNIHNNKPFGFYKIFSDTDSSQ